MTERRVLALDIGKTGCRAARYVDGERAAEAETPGVGTLAGQSSAESLLAAADAAALAVGADEVDALAAGIAGLAGSADAVNDIADPLARRHSAPRVVLASDMTTSHLGALDGAAGVVLAAGTGAVALAVASDGTTAASDGWGYLLGDAGSGCQIGRRGMDAALRAYDGRGGSAALLARTRERFGDPAGLPALVHGRTNPERWLASFAPDVLREARAGDEWAQSIRAEAVHELARTVTGAATMTFPAAARVPVATTGGLFDDDRELTDAFAMALDRQLPAARHFARAGDALTGAYLMATRAGLPHENLFTRMPGAARVRARP